MMHKNVRRYIILSSTHVGVRPAVLVTVKPNIKIEHLITYAAVENKPMQTKCNHMVIVTTSMHHYKM